MTNLTGQNKSLKKAAGAALPLFCAMWLLIGSSQSVYSADYNYDTIKRTLKNIPNVILHTGPVEEDSVVKCDDVKTFEFPQGVLKVRHMYIEERTVYNGYVPENTSHTVAYQFEPKSGTKETGVLDFYGVTENKPLEIGLRGKFLEITHGYGSHDIPLELFFAGNTSAFGFEATPYYPGKSPCKDEMP